ncbi:MAG TPA: hypothetical protein DIT25_00380 [Candidatus Moranbacteria bacterium]|nr:hypothetical protein [Candidatus Moranbacteria bacterium]
MSIRLSIPKSLFFDLLNHPEETRLSGYAEYDVTNDPDFVIQCPAFREKFTEFTGKALENLWVEIGKELKKGTFNRVLFLNTATQHKLYSHRNIVLYLPQSQIFDFLNKPREITLSGIIIWKEIPGIRHESLGRFDKKNLRDLWKDFEKNWEENMYYAICINE